MTELIDKKYKTYNWNIDVNMVDEAIRFEAIRECLSDTLKDEDQNNLSSGMDEMNLSDDKDTNQQNGLLI